MNPAFQQHLPDPACYREELIASGAPTRCPVVPAPTGGLLAALPAPPPGCRGWPWDIETPLGTRDADAPLITLVTPSFQQGTFLEETIRSVLLQNYPNLEYIVLDGGSTDGSAAVIERYRPWLSFSRIAPDRGQSHAINLGLSLGRGTIFGWINSDDFYLPGVLHQVAAACRQGAEFVYGDVLELEQTTQALHHTFSNFASARYVRFGGLVPQPSAFWAAARHQPLWEEQHCALDYELWIRLLPGLRLHHLRRPLSVARRHKEAKTHNPATKRRWDEDARRNAAAHPDLYRPGFRSRLRALEFRLVQRLWRAWHGRQLARRLDAIRTECRWEDREFAPDISVR